MNSPRLLCHIIHYALHRCIRLINVLTRLFHQIQERSNLGALFRYIVTDNGIMCLTSLEARIELVMMYGKVRGQMSVQDRQGG